MTDQVNNLPDEATCLLYTEFGCAQFLTVEQGERASLKMLLDSELQLNESRAMTQFEVIKVMNDRQFYFFLLIVLCADCNLHWCCRPFFFARLTRFPKDADIYLVHFVACFAHAFVKAQSAV